ncbi:MAG: sulfatase [Fuerstiella sp.]|nr:sulfatase [Fuerstiella sp.]MCP4854783.1 sulfatase [Fuerstiella sp.]
MTFFCLFVVLITSLSIAEAHAQDSKKPNIIIIFNDDMGYADIGCFGAPKIKTPRVDQMAKEGCRFTSFYVASAVCSASRAALLTGRYPQNVGVPGVFFPNRGSHGLDPKHFTIAELLKSAGYKTLAAGKWHLGDEPKFLPTNQGFDSFYGVPYSNDMYPARNMKYAENCNFREGLSTKQLTDVFANTPEGKQPKGMKDKVPLMRDEQCIEFPLDQTTITRRLADEGIRFIAESAKEGKPFFLYLTNPMPHTPIFASAEFEGKSAGGLYGDVIEEIDFNTGRILDALKENGVDENTLVIFTSDNGPWLIKGDHGGSAKPFRDGKGSSYEGGQRVPCVMRWPAAIPAGTESAEQATAMDLLPTFAVITGAKLPAKLKLDGHDIQNLMMGSAVAKTPYDAFYFRGGQAVRAGDWKYREGRRYGMWSGVVGKENPQVIQLFNLADDPGEANNVIQQYPEVAERMKKLFAHPPGQNASSVIPSHR